MFGWSVVDVPDGTTPIPGPANIAHATEGVGFRIFRRMFWKAHALRGMGFDENGRLHQPPRSGASASAYRSAYTSSRAATIFSIMRLARRVPW